MSVLTTTQKEAKDLVESLKKQLEKKALEAVEEKLNSLSGENRWESWPYRFHGSGIPAKTLVAWDRQQPS